MVDNATHTLASSATAKLTFNIEEEVVVIRNGWTPKEEKRRRKIYMYIYVYVHNSKSLDVVQSLYFGSKLPSSGTYK